MAQAICFAAFPKNTGMPLCPANVKMTAYARQCQRNLEEGKAMAQKTSTRSMIPQTPGARS
jgi:hypothetical protein